jgi:hypothetical protein
VEDPSRQPAAPPAFSLATVVYSRELPLLRLQARSLARHGDPAAIRQILIAVNDRDEDAVRAEVEAIRPLYGSLSDRVDIVASDRLFRWTDLRTLQDRWTRVISQPALRPLLRLGKLGWGGYEGWLMQQAFKLAIAPAITAPYAIILDTKNILTAPFDTGRFVSPAGVPLTRFQEIREKPARWLSGSAKVLGIAPPLRLRRITRYVTPFCVETDVLRQTLRAVEAAEGPVQCVFANRRPFPTEFMLVNLWCEYLSQGLDAHFAEGFAGFENLSRTSPVEVFDGALERIRTGESFGISPHAGLVGQLDAERLRSLIDALARAGVAPAEEVAAELAQTAALNGHRQRSGRGWLRPG